MRNGHYTKIDINGVAREEKSDEYPRGRIQAARMKSGEIVRLELDAPTLMGNADEIEVRDAAGKRIYPERGAAGTIDGTPEKFRAIAKLLKAHARPRGGRRKGAGRPVAPEKRFPFSFRLTAREHDYVMRVVAALRNAPMPAAEAIDRGIAPFE